MAAKGLCKTIVGLFLVIALSSCAIVPAPVSSTAGRLDTKTSIMFVESDDASASARNAEGTVRRLLTLQGYKVTASANLGVDVSFSKRPPSVGFDAAASRPDGSSMGDVRGRKYASRLNLCKEDVYRLTVSITDYRTGMTAFRGFSEEVSCQQPSDNSLYVMAAAAMRSLRGTN